MRVTGAILLMLLVQGGAPKLPEVTAEDLNGNTVEPARKVAVVGKYREFFDGVVHIYDTDLKFVLTDSKQSDLIFRLRPNQDNLEIHGAILETDPETFRVDEIRRAPSDREVFQKRLEALGPKDAEGLHELGDWARQIHSRFQIDGMDQLGESAHRRAFVIERESLSPGKPDELFRWIQRAKDTLRTRELWMEHLFQFIRDFPDHPDATRMLTQERCLRHKGRWVTYETFKAAHGLVLVGGRWLTPAQKTFEDVIRQWLSKVSANQILRILTEQQYQMHARKGHLREGMNRREVVAAWGFPDETARRREQDIPFDQWRYGDVLLHFTGGLLFDLPRETTDE